MKTQERIKYLENALSVLEKHDQDTYDCSVYYEDVHGICDTVEIDVWRDKKLLIKDMRIYFEHTRSVDVDVLDCYPWWWPTTALQSRIDFLNEYINYLKQDKKL